MKTATWLEIGLLLAAFTVANVDELAKTEYQVIPLEKAFLAALASFS